MTRHTHSMDLEMMQQYLRELDDDSRCSFAGGLDEPNEGSACITRS